MLLVWERGGVSTPDVVSVHESGVFIILEKKFCTEPRGYVLLLLLYACNFPLLDKALPPRLHLIVIRYSFFSPVASVSAVTFVLVNPARWLKSEGCTSISCWQVGLAHRNAAVHYNSLPLGGGGGEFNSDHPMDLYSSPP